jgi:hypothetical protein
MKNMISLEGSLEKIATEVSEKYLLFTGKIMSRSTFVVTDGQNEEAVGGAIRNSINGSIMSSQRPFNVNLFFTDYNYPDNICRFTELLNGSDIIEWIMDKFTQYYATFAIIIYPGQKKKYSKVWIFSRL